MRVHRASVRLGAVVIVAAVGATPATVVVVKAAAATCQTGYLKKRGGFGPVTVDGRQSVADCKVIGKFRSRYGIKPVAGLAGPATYGLARRLANTRTSNCKAKRSTCCRAARSQ